MLYYRLTDGAIVHVPTIAKTLGNISLPDGGDLSSLGYYRVVNAPKPEYNMVTQVLVRDGYVIDGANAIEQVSVRDKTTEELETEKAQKRSTAFVSKRQARQQLLLAGLLVQVQPAIDAIADPVERQMVQIFWDDSQQYERMHPQLILLAKEGLGLTDDEIDNLFLAASSL